jgi:cytochrome c peroxidase
VLTLGGLLLFAADVRPQNIALNDLRFAALPCAPKAAPANPATKDKVALGRALFWDPILSGRKDVACATCHHPRFGYAENRDLSIGVDGLGLGAARQFKTASTIPLVKRNSQTILNTAFNGITDGGAYDPSTAPMFWDVRAKGLEAQALEPIKTLEEMRGDTYTEANAIASVVSRLNAVAEYRDLFARAFAGVRPITGDQLGQALATFQRSLTASNAPFDRYMRGEATAMSDA